MTALDASPMPAARIDVSMSSERPVPWANAVEAASNSARAARSGQERRRGNRMETPPWCGRRRPASGCTALPLGIQHLTAWASVEFVLGLGRSLIGADTSRLDRGEEVGLALHRMAGHAAQHGELADVRERVRERPLVPLPEGNLDRLVRSERLVDRAERGVEARDLLLPRVGRLRIPLRGAAQAGRRHLEEVAEMGDDLERRAG